MEQAEQARQRDTITERLSGARGVLVCAPSGDGVADGLARAELGAAWWAPDHASRRRPPGGAVRLIEPLSELAAAGASFDRILVIDSGGAATFFGLGARAFAGLADALLADEGHLAILSPEPQEALAVRLAGRFEPAAAPGDAPGGLPEGLVWFAPNSRSKVNDRLEALDRTMKGPNGAAALARRLQSAEKRAAIAEARLSELEQANRGLAADVVALNQAVLSLSASQDSVARNVMVRLGGLVRKLRNRLRSSAANPPMDGAQARALLFSGGPQPDKDGAPVLVSPKDGPILPVERAQVRAHARTLIRRGQIRELGEWIAELGEGRPDYARAALYGYAAKAADALRAREVQGEMLKKALTLHENPFHMVEIARYLSARGEIGEARAMVERIRARKDAQGRDDVLKIAQLIDKKFLWENADAELLRLGAPGESAFDPDSRKAIYFLHNALPYASAGYATRSHGISLGLVKAGFNVVPATRPGFPHDLAAGSSAPAEIPPSNTIDGITYVYNTAFGRPEHTEPEYISKTADEFEKLIRAERPAVIHAASNYMTGYPALIAARRCGVPFIYEARGFWEITRASREPRFRTTAQFRGMANLEAVCAREADAAITLTTAMKDELIARGVDAGHITLVHNSVDADRFTPKPRDTALAERLGIPEGVPVIGYIGSHVIYEGLDDLIDACARLRAKGVNFRFLLVGDGKETPDLLYRAEKAGLDDVMIAPGRVPHEEVEAYYSLVDIAPFPRKPWEVCEVVSPLKPFEAMAMEKAVVVSDVRALAEIVEHDERGLQFAKGSTQALANALQRLIEDPDLRERLGKQARLWVCERRTWDVAGSRVAGVYEAVLEKAAK